MEKSQSLHGHYLRPKLDFAKNKIYASKTILARCAMSQGKGLRAYISRTFNVYQWAGAKSLIDSGSNIRSLFNSMVYVKKTKRNETFAQAVVRLGLTVADIKDKERQYKLTSSIFCVFFIFGLIYSYFLYRNKDSMTCFMGLSYSVLMFGFFFRESFWYMQIKKRELGKTVFDWLKFICWQG